MNIRIITVGKLRERYLVDGMGEYLKRLQSYANVEVLDTREEYFNEPISDRQIEAIKAKEAERIIERIPQRYYTISLDLAGKQLRSEELAQKFKQLAIYGQGNAVFIIGGALGLAQSVIKRSDFVLSFSRFTFPHQLMQLILIEQIYRAMTIIRNESYHK